MKSIKKLLSIMLVFAMLISAVPSQALAYYIERTGFDFCQYDDSYVAPTFLPDNEDAQGENEFCQWTYDSQTSTVYIDGETIESSENAYYHTRYILYNGYECYDEPSAMLPLYNLVEEDGVTKEQYCPLNFKHLIIGKNVKNFNSHISYEYYDNLETLTFEEGSELQGVGQQAFYKFPLESIELPSTVTKIGEGVFEQSNIREYDIPSSIKYIPDNMFYRSKLEKVTLNDSITQIGDYAFSKTNITELKIPDSVKSFGSHIASETLISECKFPLSLTFVPREFFAGCKNVNSIDFLSDNIKEIWEGAFRGTSITNLDFTKTNITYIGDYAFLSCKNLESVKFNANTTYLSGFNYCEKLTKIDFPSKLVEIGESAFANDENIAFSSIPSTVNRVGNYAFSKSSIESAVFQNADCKIADNVFFRCKNLKEVVLPSNLTEISDHLFAESSIRSITIPNTVKTIRRYAFYGTPLEEVKINNNGKLEYIEGYAFAECSNLTSFTFPKNMNVVRDYAFYNDVNLKYIIAYGYIQPYDKAFSLAEDETKLSITRIYGDEEIGPKWYAEKHNLEFVPFSDLTDYPDTSDVLSTNKGSWENGFWAYDESTERFLVNGTGKLTSSFKYSNGTSVSLTSLLAGKDLSSLVICEGITEIADDVFFATDGITANSISLPSTLTKIGASSFRNIKANKVRINGDIQSIGADAFYGSTIKAIDLSNCSLTSISNYAFANCSNLTEVKLPNTVTEICEGAFYNTGLTALTLDENIQTIGKKAFANCQSLSEVVVKNKDISIYSDSNKANNAFGYDSNGNLIKNTVSYSAFGKVEQTVVVDADINSNAFEYAEDNGLIVYSENQKADKSGYIQQEIPARWYYFADTKCLYIQGVYNLAEYLFPYRGSNSFIKLGGDGVFRNEDGSVASGLDVDFMYICSGVQIANAKFSQINPSYVHISNTVTEIGEDAFKDATKLKIVAIPNSVTDVKYGAFENCRSLQKITLSKNQNSIYADCFKNCTSLTDIDLDNISYIGNEAFYSCTSLNEIIIPDSVVQIDNKAFENCLGVKRISIGKNCIWISSHAFSNMPFCTSIEVNKEFDPDGPNLVWDDAIWNIGFSTTGVEVSTGDEVKIADFSGLDYTFGGSKTKITSIHFGKNVENCANLPDMQYLKDFSVSKDNKKLYVYDGNVYFNKTFLIANPNIITVRVKEGTTTIGDMAFWKSKAMQISMPDTVTSIGSYAFYQCENLKRVNLSNKLLSVEDNAFEGCKSLLTIKFPSITNSIGARCFYNCTSLQSAILPNWITKIEAYTFSGCSSLKAIVIPKLVNTIDQYAFSACKNLENIFIPKTTTTIKSTWVGFNSNMTIHTPNSSTAYNWAKNHNIKYVGYASTTAFNEVCDAQLESDGEFVDICKDGHGQTEYLTVYEPDCENDGYIIGVCEYCSTLIEEIHTEASGHNYMLTADIPATTTTKGIKQYTCTNCKETYCDYTEPLEESAISTTHNVSAKVVYASNGKLKNEAPVRRADVVIEGKTVATTNDDGVFTISLETGSYTAEIKYAYGYTRTIGIVVEDEDIDFKQSIDIVGCDFNKDGKIDSEDTEMFSLIMSSQKNDPAYLDYCDFDHNGYINAIDYAVIRSFNGTTADTYEYGLITITK